MRFATESYNRPTCGTEEPCFFDTMSTCIGTLALINVPKGQHSLLIVHHLRIHIPLHYLTEHALVLAYRLLSTLLIRSEAAQARATATIPAVSLRNRYGPSAAKLKPASSAVANSLSLHPPSGPTNRPTVEPNTTSSRGGRPDPLCKSTPSSLASRTASEKGTISPTSGTRSRKDCRAAASATRRQRRTFPSPFESLTTPRSVERGTTRLTPSSVAFSTTRSMC